MQAKLFSHRERKGETQQVEPPSHPPEGQQPAKAVNFTYNMIGLTLQGGVILSAAVILVGLLLESLRPDKFAPQKLQAS
jgi:hypothetical protein